MKKSLFLILIFGSSILTKTFGQNNDDVQGTWNGTASLVEKLSGQFFKSERYIDVTIKDNIVTGSHKYKGTFLAGPDIPDECFGTGPGELTSVTIRTWDGTYDINILSPECKLVADGGNSGTGGTNIGISNQKLQLINGQLNTTELSGTETTTRNIGDAGTYTVTTTWHLVRSLDVELIVTPVGYDITGAQKIYDDWLPEPGKDETNKGSYMKIKLSLKSKSGTPLKYKAQSFELKLSNTSSEPGITINYPLSPAANQLPDLRFIPAAIAESNHQDQDITIPCKNGISGQTFIASYDGGGRTILNVEAVLTDGFHIKGQLLVSGGDEDILIPKRDPNSNIATAWLTANGNPGETDDDDQSKDNSNNGDGLSAYEEYRGVICTEKFGSSNPNKFGRLDPKRKELGVRVDKAELPLFSLGLKWFENGTGLQLLRFNEMEIGADRRLNKNVNTAHIYDQYALLLYKGLLGYMREQPLGVAFTTTNKPEIPANTQNVVIDMGAVQNEYNVIAARERPAQLPFTVTELLANTVAHELSHGVRVFHHGQQPDQRSPLTATPANQSPYYTFRVFDRNGAEFTLPYTLTGKIGIPGSVESGDLSCIMVYYPYYSWAFTTGADFAKIYNKVPLIPMGNKMCNSGRGTGFNHSIIYFGDAEMGNCLGQIKLKP